MSSIDEESAQEIDFAKYQDHFKLDKDDDDFEVSEDYSVHNSQSFKKQPTQSKQNAQSKQQPSVNVFKQSTVSNKFSQNKNKFDENSDDDQAYSDDFGKEIKIGGTQNQKNDQASDKFDEDFEDEEGSAQFDNAFKYQKEDFDLDNSESQNSFNDKKAPITQNQNSINNFTIHKQNTTSNNKNQSTINNVFKDKALIDSQKSINNQQPIFRQQTNKPQEYQGFQNRQQTFKQDSIAESAEEIKIGQNQNDINSDVGFDESIQDEAFQEESIKDEFDEISQKSSQRNKNKQYDMVNMASVIPNPKRVNDEQTLNRNQPFNNITSQNNQKGNQFQQKIDEESFKEEEHNQGTQQFPVFSYEKPKQQVEDNDDFVDDELHEKINAIPSRFSDAGSPDKYLNNQQQEEEKKQKKSRKNESLKRATNKLRPLTAKPNQSKTRGSSKPPQNKKKEVQDKNKINQQIHQDEEEEKQQPNEEQKQSLIEKVTKNLLTKNKSTKIVMRPESAKPKVGYDGNPNTLGKVKPPSANHNDLTQQLAQSNRMQLIRQQKKELEKKKQELLVRSLKQANVIKQKQKETKAAQEEIKKVVEDNDSFFEEAEPILGDQGVAPGGMNEDLDEFKDDDDVNLANQSARMSIKDMAQIKQQTQVYQAKTESKQNTQQMNATQNQNMNPNQPQKAAAKLQNMTPQAIALQKQKEQAAANISAKNSQVFLGANDDRFNEILRQKKEKLVNKDVLGFMMEKNQRNQNEKKEALTQNINKIAKEFELKDVPKQTLALQQQQNKGSDKVPEHAKLVIDDEKLVKELTDLKKRFKETILENIKVCNNIKLVEKKKRDKESLFDKIMNDKNLITINGALTVQGENSKASTGLLYGIKLEDIPDFDKLAKERINPLESVVKKFEQKGITVEQAFELFDDDEDRVLTISEIKMGIKNQRIELLDSEYEELLKAIDANSDGVLTQEEWVNCLLPKFDEQKEFRQIMQNVDIDDPLILEERILDLRYRSQRIEQELEVLRETSGNEQGFDLKDRIKRKMKNPLEKKYAERILTLESKLADKVQFTLFEKIMLEDKIKRSLMAKDEVQQDYYEAKRQKERIETEYNMRLETIQGTLRVLDEKMSELTQINLMQKTERDVIKQGLHRMQISLASMTEMESKLDKQLEQILGRALTGEDLEMLYQLDLKTLRELNSGQNELFDGYVKQFACITIQRMFKGSMARHDYAIMKFQMKRLKRILGVKILIIFITYVQPVVRNRFQMKRLGAVIKLQRFYRKYQDRKRHIENLRKKNMMRKLKEEEEDKFFQDQEKKKAAAMIILKHWRAYKRRQIRDFGLISKYTQNMTYGREIEVVYFAQMRKCFICKLNNALRLCQAVSSQYHSIMFQCQDAFYCDQCYIDYHIRGHRKLHSYKRIRYGTKPVNEEDEKRERDNFLKKDFRFSSNQLSLNMNTNQNNTSQNQQPSNQINTLNMDGSFSFRAQINNNTFQADNSFDRDPSSKLNTLNNQYNLSPDELIQKEKQAQQTFNNYTQELQKTQLKINQTDNSDEGFLNRVLKNMGDFREDVEVKTSDDHISLSELRQFLLSYRKTYKLNSEEEIDRLLEILQDRCEYINENMEDSSAIATYIDLEKVKSLSVKAIDPLVLDHLSQTADFNKNKFSALFSPESFVDSWTKVVNLFSRSDQQNQEEWNRIQKTGIMISGEGTAEDIMQQRKKMQERQRLEEMLRNGEYSSKPEENKKLYKLYQEKVNQNSVKTYDVDHSKLQTAFANTQYMSLQQVSSFSIPQQIQGRALQQQILQIYTLNEDYPTKCYNGGQLSAQSQLYYMCKQQGTVGASQFRVEKSQYDMIQANYTQLFECETKTVQNNVCVCPQGFYDLECKSQLYRQCFVNITDPPLYKGCQKEDSPYYLYSVPGYDPCFYLDFTQRQSIGFILTCKYTNDVPDINPNTENVGYRYKDVVQPPTYQLFQYDAFNPNTQMRAIRGQQAQVQISIYDWKWLSKQANFITNVTDPQVIAGLQKSYVEVDFPNMLKSDSDKKSKYIAGGRAYFEADVLGSLIFSYTSKGFFDQANYVEPAAPQNITWKIIVGVVVPGVVIGLILSVIFYYQWKKRNAKLRHVD